MFSCWSWPTETCKYYWKSDSYMVRHILTSLYGSLPGSAPQIQVLLSPYCRSGTSTEIKVINALPAHQLYDFYAVPRRSILLCKMKYCTIILTVYGSYWKVVQYIEWIKSGLIFIAQYGKYSIVCGQHCAISLQSLSRKVVQWTSSRVNNYGYESNRRREKIYFSVSKYKVVQIWPGLICM